MTTMPGAGGAMAMVPMVGAVVMAGAVAMATMVPMAGPDADPSWFLGTVVGPDA